MCGIGGVKRMGKEAIPRDAVDILLEGLQERGNDATGVALINPQKSAVPGLHVYKVDDPSWRAVAAKPYKDWMEKHLLPETYTIILHTRAATKGNPRISANNHPMHFDKCAVVHNGVIHNDDFLFTEMKIERHAETDSDLLRGILDKEGLTKGAIRQIDRVSGAVACAALSPDDPEKLLLVRSGTPIVCAELNDLFIFASEKRFIHSAFRPWKERWGVEFQKGTIPGIGWLTMRDDTAWIMGAKGLEWHDHCKTANNYNEPNRRVWQNYAERNAKWDADAQKKLPLPPTSRTSTPVRIYCTHCKGLNKLTPDHYDIPPTNLICGHCEKPLVPAQA